MMIDKLFEQQPTPAVMMQIAEEWNKRNQEYTRILFDGPRAKVGQTPKDLVWSLNKARLYRYRATCQEGPRVPLLMVYALINRAYILDLAPGRSLVEYLVNRGFDVYLLDWGTPGLEDREIDFGDYVCKYIPKAVRKMQRLSNSKEFSILGYCQGGTISSMYASIYPNSGLENLILMASPIDFSYHPYYSTWLRNKYFDVDRMVDTLGNIPGPMIDWGNRMLKPMQNFVSSEYALWNNSVNDRFLQNWAPMNKWLNDGPPFPGEAFRNWIKDLYQDNKLVKGELVINGHKIDLGRAKANLLAIGASEDHIALPEQVKAAVDHFGSQDKEYFEVPAGHVALTVSSRGTKVTWPKIGDWLTERSGEMVPREVK
ncbi:class III poly(R)-hydroxyalkanoic acid synthase subunit PhaC [Heliorestis convoluta]|uniref:Poly(3-hydroxyalkanoate) polymerase subunit PhaC n=1 Tax=Heliorestis convoluta TaxID=356322 RepID=A0A5Q2MWC4_9FIRM|nr:class III poly(R)-hydroxyalkanoic acid synthase subunit PhaC [Heliorestis convoluta]QGG46744.1 class III poly(R)-hydroxyalkanoic acid synthase, PhaC subunit [Heliorestis convoluta]